MSKKKVIIKKLLEKGIGTKSILNKSDVADLENLLETGTYQIIPYNIIHNKIIKREPIKEWTPLYNWMKLNSVTFPLPRISYDEFQSNPAIAPRSSNPWGEVNYFLEELQRRLGYNWATKILATKKDSVTRKTIPLYDINTIKGIKRLGVPGKQGTVIKLNYNGIDYAIKVVSKKITCGDGSSGSTTFLKQARLQQIAAEWGITCPVYAVHCIPGKKEAAFMAMPMMGQRIVDIYGTSKKWSEQHQKELWNCYLILDKYVGLLHNDSNCLNVMTDKNNKIKLIDFDMSSLFVPRTIKKWSLFCNLCFLPLHRCFTTSIKKNPEILYKAIRKLFPIIRRKEKGLLKGRQADCKKYDLKGAVFFKPFNLIEPAIAKFPNPFTALKFFCKLSNYKNWKLLNKDIHSLLQDVARICIEDNIGNIELAHKIINYQTSIFSPTTNTSVIQPRLLGKINDKYYGILNGNLVNSSDLKKWNIVRKNTEEFNNIFTTIPIPPPPPPPPPLVIQPRLLGKINGKYYGVLNGDLVSSLDLNNWNIIRRDSDEFDTIISELRNNGIL